MRTNVLSLLFCFLFLTANSQSDVGITGKIENYQDEFLLLSDGFILTQLQLSDDGRFELSQSYQQSPFMMQLMSSSPKGKLTKITPVIWFDTKTLELTVDLADNSFKSSAEMPFQELSENIESSKGQNQRTIILNNPNQWPSFYFANKFKAEMKTEALKDFLQATEEPFLSSSYYLKLKNYVEAKQRGPLKKGEMVKDFSLPDKNGELYSVLQGKGKTTLIALFSSGCSYSIASIDLLAQLNALNVDKIEIISIWDDPDEHSWIHMHADKKEKINWVNLLDQYGFTSTYFDNEISPEFFVIDSEGVLVDKFNGYNEKTAKKLRALLQ